MTPPDPLDELSAALAAAGRGDLDGALHRVRGASAGENAGGPLAGLARSLEAFLEMFQTSVTEKEWIVGELQLHQADLEATNEHLREEMHRRAQVEAELRLAQKLEAIGRLAAGIAHEINTPIQYIGDNAHFLEDAFGHLRALAEEVRRTVAALREGAAGGPLAASLSAALSEHEVDYLEQEVPDALRQTLDGVGQVAAIVQGMKEFSHPGSAEKAPVDLNRAVATTVLVSRNEWKQVAEVETDLDPALPTVLCLAGEMNQVLLNLLVNAAQAVAEVAGARPGGRGRIVVTTRREGDAAEIRFQDDGPGIPAEIQDRIFDPFFTTKAVGKGTGQGLAIARAVIERHAGTLECRSRPGAGATFVVRLPFAPSGPPTSPAARPA